MRLVSYNSSFPYFNEDSIFNAVISENDENNSFSLHSIDLKIENQTYPYLYCVQMNENSYFNIHEINFENYNFDEYKLYQIQNFNEQLIYQRNILENYLQPNLSLENVDAYIPSSASYIVCDQTSMQEFYGYKNNILQCRFTNTTYNIDFEIFILLRPKLYEITTLRLDAIITNQLVTFIFST